MSVGAAAQHSTGHTVNNMYLGRLVLLRYSLTTMCYSTFIPCACIRAKNEGGTLSPWWHISPRWLTSKPPPHIFLPQRSDCLADPTGKATKFCTDSAPTPTWRPTSTLQKPRGNAYALPYKGPPMTYASSPSQLCVAPPSNCSTKYSPVFAKIFTSFA